MNMCVEYALAFRTSAGAMITAKVGNTSENPMAIFASMPFQNENNNKLRLLDGMGEDVSNGLSYPAVCAR